MLSAMMAILLKMRPRKFKKDNHIVKDWLLSECRVEWMQGSFLVNTEFYNFNHGYLEGFFFLPSIVLHFSLRLWNFVKTLNLWKLQQMSLNSKFLIVLIGEKVIDLWRKGTKIHKTFNAEWARTNHMRLIEFIKFVNFCVFV